MSKAMDKIQEHEVSSFLKLPVEIVIQILSYLDVSDLYNIAETCIALNGIINDEELWKNLFLKRFHTNHFSSVSGSFKFSVELFERNELIHRWKKSTGVHKIFTINTSSIEKVIFNYPKLLSFSDQGDINISSIDKGKTDTTIPMTTPAGCTSYSFNAHASVFGRIDGRIYGKLLATKSYLSSITEFNRAHEGMVTTIDHDDTKCYSGDEKGKVFTWDLKNGEFLKEYNVSNEAIINVKGHGNIILALDSQYLYIIENDTVRSIKHSEGADFFDVDFGGGIAIVGNLHDLFIYSYHRSSFGRVKTISIGQNDEIWRLGLENKKATGRDLKVAGYDGCNLGVVTRLGKVLTYNIRDAKLGAGDSSLQAQCQILPMFDTLKIPSGFPPISSIAVNSSVILLGSYNGFAAVYDVLTGEFIKLVSNRIPKRHLPLNQAPYLIPVKFVELSPRNQTNGVLIVNNVVQYFQFGKSLYELQKIDKKKKYLAGVAGDRKNKLMKKIKHDMDELHYEDYEKYKEDKILDKYNGLDLTDQEQIELAMVLNHSLNDQSHNTGKEIDDELDDVDEELSRVLELSKIEHSSEPLTLAKPIEGSSTSQTDSGAQDDVDDDADFEAQLQEALRRSLNE